MKPNKRINWKRLGIVALAAAALAAAWRYTPLSELLTLQNLNAWAKVLRQTPWAPLVLVAAYTPASLVMFPRPLLTLVSVVAFGTWLGIAYAVAGIMVAALATYAAGRFMRRDTVRRLAGEGFDPAIKVLKNHGVLAIFALNQAPVPPFAIQGLVAGAVRVNVWHYAFGSLLGLAPAMLAWTLFGNQISAALDDASQISWWMVALAAAVLILGTWGVRRWFAREATSSPPAPRRT